MTAFVKLYGDLLLNSSLWLEPPHVRLAFIGLLAKANWDGVVPIPSTPALAHMLNMPVADVESALITLSSPDPHSRTPALDGRRIVRIPEGWRVVNHTHYRDSRSHSTESARARKAKERGRKRDMSQQRGHVAEDVEVEAGKTCAPDAEVAVPARRELTVADVWPELDKGRRSERGRRTAPVDIDPDRKARDIEWWDAVVGNGQFEKGPI